MASVTFQLIDGLERGRVYSDLTTPVTIGREEDNSIQLNDERVSRFHAKVQDDDGRIILTDLDSTNGTRVNGHPVQMRVLQIGDQVAIGRCLLIYGSREEVVERFGGDVAPKSDSGLSDPSGQTIATQAGDGLLKSMSDSDSGIAAAVPSANDSQTELFPHGPPPPPTGLRPVHRAELSDFAAYVHEQIRRILQAGAEESEAPDAVVQVDRATWQGLLHLEMDLAVYLRKLAEPDN